jgi:hypothetical protein
MTARLAALAWQLAQFAHRLASAHRVVDSRGLPLVVGDRNTTGPAAEAGPTFGAGDPAPGRSEYAAPGPRPGL